MALFDHQRFGAVFLAERRFALLADEPGLGKTATTVTAADLAQVKRILVVCPGAVRHHWHLEFERWQTVPRPITVKDGYLSAPPAREGVTVVSHACLSDAGVGSKSGRVGSLHWLLAGAPYDLIVVDESHEFRAYTANRTKTLFGPDGLASRASRVWCLSGTPMVNSACDLYPMVYGALGSQVSWEDFGRHYCDMRPDGFNGIKPVGIKNAAELSAGLKPFVLRRTIESVGIQLPPLTVNRTPIHVPVEAVSQVMAMLEGWSPHQLRAAIESQDDSREAALSRVRRALGTAKAAAVADHVTSLLAFGEGPLVVFYQHKDVKTALYSILSGQGWRVSWIDGGVTVKQFSAAREWFQAGGLDVLLVQTQAGGVGLTLHRAHRAVIAESPWTATALEQSVKRIHRIGQTKACIAENLFAPACWLDEVLASVVSKKESASNELLSLLTTNN